MGNRMDSSLACSDMQLSDRSWNPNQAFRRLPPQDDTNNTVTPGATVTFVENQASRVTEPKMKLHGDFSFCEPAQAVFQRTNTVIKIPCRRNTDTLNSHDRYPSGKAVCQLSLITTCRLWETAPFVKAFPWIENSPHPILVGFVIVPIGRSC